MAIKIFIDQGHNPSNPNAGAEGNGLKEQDLTYKIGVELAQLLNSNPNFDQDQDSDQDPNQERIDYGNFPLTLNNCVFDDEEE